METINRDFKAKDRFGADMQFALVPPTLQIETEGERYYKIAYSQALSQGIFPREKLRGVMKDHGMWTEEDEKKYKTIVAKIALWHAELLQFEQTGDTEKCKKIAMEMDGERDKMWSLFLIQQSVFMHSAEAMAELVKTEAMMAACTRLKATGERYWKDYTEFVREKEQNLKSTVYMEVVEVQSNLLKSIREDIEGKYPETKYLKDVRESILDRAIAEDVQKEIARRKEAALEGLNNNAEMESEDIGEPVSGNQDGGDASTAPSTSTA
jgi:hypothetical protein